MASWPPTLADALGLALQHRALAIPLQGWSAVEAWSSLVGSRIAARTRAVEYRDGQLTVEVQGATWLAELTLLRREILARVVAGASRTGVPSPVATIRFVQAPGPAAPGAKPGDTAVLPGIESVAQKQPARSRPRRALDRARVQPERSPSGQEG